MCNSIKINLKTYPGISNYNYPGMYSLESKTSDFIFLAEFLLLHNNCGISHNCVQISGNISTV